MIVIMKARSNRDYNILNKITEADHEKKPKIKKTSKVNSRLRKMYVLVCIQ